ncbi:NAD-dependent epimerase/dehydratase family protein [Azonexus sp. IMCC34839]|uniref:NAD-dependent epimerase/dehydratase family protein n=1 Tax=Azonexus sp. IMCC34839 TaxID=3133695 RepID=UPI00399B6BE5
MALSGANGFVGRAMLGRLIQENRSVTAFVREGGAQQLGGIDVAVASLVDRASWSDVLRQCSVFVHCAGQAHLIKGPRRDALLEFRKVNTDLTLALAKSAAAAGVKRFVFVSSIGVNGLTSGEEPFGPEAVPNPQTPYAISKYEAEQGLHAISQETGLEVVVVRPPLVYGAGAPGNFRTLVTMLRRRLPLPLGAVTMNRRSYVALSNLVDLLMTVCDHPAAANQVFLVSDDEDLSTVDLLCRLGATMGLPPRLLPVPLGVLALGAKLLGKPEMFRSLCGSLQVDTSKTRKLLGWRPPIGVDEGLKQAVGGQRC